MTATIIPAVRKLVRVNATPARAFEIFTAGMRRIGSMGTALRRRRCASSSMARMPG